MLGSVGGWSCVRGRLLPRRLGKSRRRRNGPAVRTPVLQSGSIAVREYRMTGKLRGGLRLGPQVLFGAIVLGGIGVTCLFLLVQTWV